MRCLTACLLLAALAWSARAELDPKALFEAPVALGDASGQPLISGKAQGCPYAADFNADGKVDLVLGAKDGMETASGGLWLIPNRGTNEKPAFAWSDAWRVKLPEGDLGVSCGCKSSGQVQPVAVDLNGDGYLDIAYSDTYRRAYLLLNDGKDREHPTFTQQKFFDMEKTNHGMYAGGGDWNGDGVLDFLHMTFAGAQFKVFKGAPVEGGKGVKFAEGGLPAAEVLKITGEKARKCAWAWDYSGTAKQRGVVEYVGVFRPEGGREEIAFFEVKDGVSRKLATLAQTAGQTPLLTASDLNADGRMDILFSCGLWRAETEHTKVWVMYGKGE
ncbi:MAG: VCBS repeat-containing protein [Planctomycetota bacterium]|nr:VCBS repeat-containing protein [Planctomycetota bacterium]